MVRPPHAARPDRAAQAHLARLRSKTDPELIETALRFRPDISTQLLLAKHLGCSERALSNAHSTSKAHAPLPAPVKERLLEYVVREGATPPQPLRGAGRPPGAATPKPALYLLPEELERFVRCAAREGGQRVAIAAAVGKYLKRKILRSTPVPAGATSIRVWLGPALSKTLESRIGDPDTRSAHLRIAVLAWVTASERAAAQDEPLSRAS